MSARFDLAEQVNTPIQIYGDNARTFGAFRNFRHAAKLCKSNGWEHNYQYFIGKARAATKSRKRRTA